MTQKDPKWPKNFPQFFFDWKGGSANFFALRMYDSRVEHNVQDVYMWLAFFLTSALPKHCLVLAITGQTIGNAIFHFAALWRSVTIEIAAFGYYFKLGHLTGGQVAHLYVHWWPRWTGRLFELITHMSEHTHVPYTCLYLNWSTYVCRQSPAPIWYY